MSKQLSDTQTQELTDLLPDQILDGLGRSLMSAANAFAKKHVTVTIAGFETCKVELD